MVNKNLKVSLVAVAVSAMMAAASTTLPVQKRDRDRASLQSRGDSTRAEEILRDALRLSETKEREQVRQQFEEAAGLLMPREADKAAQGALRLGDSYRYQIRYFDSLYFYKRALQLKPLGGSVKAAAFSSIAAVYADVYQRGLAFHYYTRALDQARISQDKLAQAVALTGLAGSHYQGGDRAQARVFIKQARKSIRGRDNPEVEPALYYLDGKVDLDSGLTEQAMNAFDRALAGYQVTGNVEGQVKALCAMSAANLASDRKQLALECSRKAIELAEKQANSTRLADRTRASELLWRAWRSRAHAQRAMGQDADALASYRPVVFYLEKYWSVTQISTQASAAASREEPHQVYRELADLLVNRGDAQKALDFMETARAKASSGLILARQQMGTKHYAQNETVRDRDHLVTRLRTQLISSSMGATQRSALERELSDAEYAQQEARLQKEMEHFRDRARAAEFATVEQLQKNMIGGKATVVEFLLGEKRSFVWLVSSDTVVLKILPGRKEIEDAFNAYREVLTVPPNNAHLDMDLRNLKVLGEKLFSLLFGPISKELAQREKLIIVPDGLLHYLPFEALIHDGRYLVEDHAISYLQSANMLSLWPDKARGTEAVKTAELFALGDPVFEPEPTAIARNGIRKNGADVLRRMRSFDFQLERLPRTRDEVEHIAELFPSRSRHYLGKESTEDAVKRERLRGYRRLHFATHSLINEATPDRSAIVLTLDADPKEDGLLEASEISELDLDCDLVVLSACQTGRGQLLSGEGVVGLSRAFLTAGARSVVVSLWSVSDIPTGRLMKYFYENLARNTDNVDSLRLAKLEMLRGNLGLSHPYYWAAFISTGKP